MASNEITNFEAFVHDFQDLPAEVQNMIKQYTIPASQTTTTPVHSTPASAPRMSTFENFVTEFHNLPAELRIMIEDYTFDADPCVEDITQDYKPPSVLQVSREKREMFAPGYFERTTFHAPTQGPLRKWLVSLPTEHRRKIKTIHYELPNPNYDDPDIEIKEAPINEEPKAPEPNQPPVTRGSKKVRKPTPPRKPKKVPKQTATQDRNLRVQKRATARLFFVTSYLSKRKIRLPDEIIRTNMRFEGMEEPMWSSTPHLAYKAWFKWRERTAWMRDGEVPAWTGGE